MCFEIFLSVSSNSQSQMAQTIYGNVESGVSICYKISQMQKNRRCMYKILNVGVTWGGDIVYNSRTGPFVGEAEAL